MVRVCHLGHLVNRCSPAGVTRWLAMIYHELQHVIEVNDFTLLWKTNLRCQGSSTVMLLLGQCHPPWHSFSEHLAQ